MNVLISIITVNYFSEDDIIECFASVMEHTNNLDVELILVSNSPVEKAFREHINKLGFSVKVIQNEKNFGFGKACNIGARSATGEYLFFLNPDTLFRNDVLAELVRCYKQFDISGIIGPKTFTKSGKPFASVKNHISIGTFFNIAFPVLEHLLPKKTTAGHYSISNTRSVPVINGHAMFMKRSFYKKLGGFDERFFMFWEENDICYRSIQLGYKVIYCSRAEVIHKAGTSTRSLFLPMEIEKHRSQKKFILLHHHSWNTLNRFSGIVGYAWRAIGSLFTLRKQKIKQFWTLFYWYLLKYD